MTVFEDKVEITGEQGKLYVGNSLAVDLTEAELVGGVLKFTRPTSTFNVLTSAPVLGEHYETAIAGNFTTTTTSVTLKVYDKQEYNASLTRLQGLHDNRKTVPVGIIKPEDYVAGTGSVRKGLINEVSGTDVDGGTIYQITLTITLFEAPQSFTLGTTPPVVDEE